MKTVAILGAGDLGATLARRLAEGGRCGSIVLVDEDLGRARGKALDLLQSGPLEGCDTRITGAGSLDGLAALDALVVADATGLPRASAGTDPPDSFVKTWVAAAGSGILLEAEAWGGRLVAGAVRAGLPQERVLGSSPLATAGALQAALADALLVKASAVALTVMGRPPERTILPRGSATVGGIPVERIAPLAERRALQAVARSTRGPVALATAAARVLHAVFASASSVLPVFAALQGEYGHRGVVLAVPARLGQGRLQGVVDLTLDAVDRTAFDTLADQARRS
jgi:malate dehydrogenase